MRPLLAFAVLVILVATDASAQQFPAPHKDPFARLFTSDGAPAIGTLTIAPAPAVAPVSPAPTAATVVCGMTLVPVDPGIDPRIQVKPPLGHVKPAIRVVAPTVCQ